MHYDEIMEGLLSRQKPLTVEAFGGLDRVLADGAQIGVSLFPDMFVELVLPYREEHRIQVDNFITTVLAVIERGPELNTIADKLLALHLQDPASEVKVFRRLLATATERVRPAPLRTAALKGALAFARDDAIRLTKMVSELTETEPNDDPIYISHAARIAGVLAAKTRNPALGQFLRLMSDIDGSSDQVHLELGLLSLQDAIEGEDTSLVLRNLHLARDQFERAAVIRESRYDARLYETAISLLLGFYDRAVPPNFDKLLRSLKENAFAYTEYSMASRQDPILGSIATQVAALVSLVENLSCLVERIQEDVWLDAIHVIEQHLLFAYEANRSVFAAAPGRGLDCVIRPVLEPKVFGNRDHLKHLMAWFRRHAAKFDVDLTRDLQNAVERAYQGGSDFSPAAGVTSPLTPALQERVRSTDERAHSELIEEVLSISSKQQLMNIAPPIEKMLEIVDRDFAHLEDYRRPAARVDFMLLVFRVATFLQLKLDSSVEQDRFSAYLFKRGRELPHEKELQQDFLRHGKSAGLPVDDEAKGVAGGRADIRYKTNGHTAIIEVKRELIDASFDRLLTAYGDQTVIYQATNIKLGVMLVLDLSNDHSKLSHMDTWYTTRCGDLLGDGTERGVLIVKIPGRRGTPSAATVAAKKRDARRKKAPSEAD
ncbi:hypothetical protein [Vogesella indigofera]|uniref:hypothetical protein n=1 Tax=Vogesella indigofera TaxID=45465 RepID=UPI0035AE82EF